MSYDKIHSSKRGPATAIHSILCIHYQNDIYGRHQVYEIQRGRPVYTGVDQLAFFGLGPKTSQFQLSCVGHMWNV